MGGIISSFGFFKTPHSHVFVLERDGLPLCYCGMDSNEVFEEDAQSADCSIFHLPTIEFQKVGDEWLCRIVAE